MTTPEEWAALEARITAVEQQLARWFGYVREAKESLRAYEAAHSSEGVE